jgi:hypothetical protein
MPLVDRCRWTDFGGAPAGSFTGNAEWQCLHDTRPVGISGPLNASYEPGHGDIDLGFEYGQGRTPASLWAQYVRFPTRLVAHAGAFFPCAECLLRRYATPAGQCAPMAGAAVFVWESMVGSEHIVIRWLAQATQKHRGRLRLIRCMYRILTLYQTDGRTIWAAFTVRCRIHSALQVILVTPKNATPRKVAIHSDQAATSTHASLVVSD